MPVQRYFTADEANAALGQVRPLAEKMVEHRRKMLAAQARQEELGARVAGNGGGIDPGEPARAEEAVEREMSVIAECIDAILDLGVQVKDIDTGLLDFPALRSDGTEALLCWRVGEDEIRYWHSLEGGFAGRRPLPLD
jgi:hypothetical protein